MQKNQRTGADTLSFSSQPRWHGRRPGSAAGSVLLMSTALLLAASCSRERHRFELSDANVVKSSPHANQTIGDDQAQIKIMSGAVVNDQMNAGLFQPTALALPPDPTSLIASFPNSLLEKPMLLGSVITKVSDTESEDLGGLKLTDISPLLVMPKVMSDASGTYLVLFNCNGNCSAPSHGVTLAIPAVGTDAANQATLLDLAALGSNLELTQFYPGEPTIDQYQTQSSKTVRFDYAKSTLVFDVEAALTKKKDPSGAVTTITNRWYLKLADPFNPNFKKREPLAAVGFFTTERSDEPLITRWDFDQNNQDGIKYYVKNVPTEFQKAFASCFDEWNAKLLPITGYKTFDYEFIPAGDPRNELLTAGDIRYNIVEWDLVNKAGYGGLGPSVAHQFTGEEFNANVLIQGPTVIQIYTQWFKTAAHANDLMAQGHVLAAQALMASARGQIEAARQAKPASKYALTLGKGKLAFTVRSQLPSLEDPLAQREDFDNIPAGVTYESYMFGYFHDMLTHELGHNLGLRHNFRGNLGAADQLTQHGVSRSVMEYLGRGYRHLDGVGEYDVMALSYGYAGKLPTHSDWFCTDEDQADLTDATKSAECSQADATNDPFSYFENRLDHALDLIVARGQSGAPAWKVSNMARELTVALTGLGTYALSADATFDTWTAFAKPGRPTRAADVRPFVLDLLKRKLCDPGLTHEVSTKSDASAQAATQANLDALRSEALKELQPVFSAEELRCDGI